MGETSRTTQTYSDEYVSREPLPTLRLLFEGGSGLVDSPARYLDSGEELIAGRSVGHLGLQFNDPRTSRHHATIRFQNGRAEIFDKSRNGTFVNGRRVDRAILGDGDIIRMGDTFLLFRYVPPGITDTPIDGMLGKAPSICQLRQIIAMVAPTDATVLVLGESGTGKELVARAVHELSGRDGPFIPVNCSTIPESLAESQLFGHQAGSFTDARSDHKGHFQQADGGTLFLDELGELPMPVQAKLLRVLEERAVTPMGSSRPEPVNVRMVAATNRDLQSAVTTDRFRGDLYSRLAEISIRTPPLRERREDILLLLKHGLSSASPKLAPELVGALLLHPWRYNVRELLKVAKQLRIYGATAQRLELGLVKDRLERYQDTNAEPDSMHGNPGFAVPDDMPVRPASRPRPTVPNRKELLDLVIENKGNISALSRALGRSRRQIYRYLDKYGINLDDYR